MTTIGRLTLTAFLLAGACETAFSQDVGTIQEEGLEAWANKMPPGPHSIHLKGMITAPTPCHRAVTTYLGDLKPLPPVYLVKVTIVAQPGVMCIQKISDIPFAYEQQNYVGTHEEIEVSSDTDKKRVKIEIVQ